MTIEDFIEAVDPFAKARIHHAAQLRDLKTYVLLGHVASRSELFKQGKGGYTPFPSDSFDVLEGCDDDFFGNLPDQSSYGKNGNSIPNIYGPITLVFRPSSLRDSGANNVTVRRGAIWSKNADSRVALTPDDVTRLYLNPFGTAGAGELQIHRGSLQLIDLESVIVNPITLHGHDLINGVRDLLGHTRTRHGHPINIVERDFGGDGRDIYDKLVAWAADFGENAGNYESLPGIIQERFARLGDWKKGNLKRFSGYLSHGTISVVFGNTLAAETVDFDDDYDEPEYDTAEPEYDFGRISDLTELSESELSERNEIMVETLRIEAALRKARISLDGQRDADLISLWEDYVDIVDNLNQWIERIRNRILEGRDAMHESILGSHDGQLSADLTGWADEFDEVDIPRSDSEAYKTSLLNWRRVLRYSDGCG
jgi:hypothetical protein